MTKILELNEDDISSIFKEDRTTFVTLDKLTLDHFKDNIREISYFFDVIFFCYKDKKRLLKNTI